MLPNLYDLSFAEERCRDLRRQAGECRLLQASRLALVPGPSLLVRVRAVLSRLHLIRSISGRAEAPA